MWRNSHPAAALGLRYAPPVRLATLSKELKMQKEEDYLELLQTLLEVVEVNKGTVAGDDDRVLDAEGLAIKCFSHACSLLYLLRGTNVPDVGAAFFDPGSINVLGRAMLESFLVFYYLFVDPETTEEGTFRYHSWLYKDLLERQKFPAKSTVGKEILKKEKTVISALRSKIEGSSSYAKLTPKQRQSLIEGREWRFKGWKRIAVSAGLSEVHSEAFYTYLCSYAHAGSLSVLQIRQCETAAHQQGLVGATMGLAMICIAYMTKAYCTYFPKSRSVLEKNEHHQTTIQMWTEIGASNLDGADIDWDALNG